MRLFKELFQGRKVYLGQIDNSIYSRNVKNIHLYEFSTPDGKVKKGWFIDKDAFEQHVLPKCNHIIIRNIETNTLYMVKTSVFLSASTLLRDRYVLPIESWEVKSDEPAMKKVEIICEN